MNWFCFDGGSLQNLPVLLVSGGSGLTFYLLGLVGTGFGHLDAALTLGVEQSPFQSSGPGLGVGGGVAGTPGAELVLAVTWRTEIR